MEIHISPRSITKSSMKPCTSAVTQKISSNLWSSADSQCCTNFYAMQSPRLLDLLPIITILRGVRCRGSCFHSGSQCSVCGQHQGLVDVLSYLLVHLVLFSTCTGFSQPPIVATIQSVVHRSCEHSPFRIHLFQCT